MHEFIGIAIVFTILAGAWAISSLKERRRLKGLGAFAEESGLDLLSVPPASDLSSLFELAFVKHEGTGRCGNAFVADNGQTRVVIFDYSIKTGSGKSEKTRNFVLSLITDQRMQLPVLRIATQTLSSKLFDMMSKKTIAIDKDLDFNKEFHVTGPLEEPVVEFLTPANREQFRKFRFPCVEMKEAICLLELSKTKLTGETARKHLADSLAFCGPWRAAPN